LRNRIRSKKRKLIRNKKEKKELLENIGIACVVMLIILMGIWKLLEIIIWLIKLLEKIG